MGDIKKAGTYVPWGAKAAPVFSLSKGMYCSIHNQTEVNHGPVDQEIMREHAIVSGALPWYVSPWFKLTLHKFDCVILTARNTCSLAMTMMMNGVGAGKK
jgi:hypothetical protein